MTEPYKELTELVLRHYPTGINKDNEPEYFKDKRITELRNFIRDTTSKRFNQWNAFLEVLSEELELEIFGSTSGNRPSMAGTCILNRHYYDSVFHVQTLVFSISILGPYYEVFGIDSTGILENGKPRYLKTNLITVSPMFEFEIPFIKIEEAIKCKYNYKLIPYNLKNRTVRNVQSLNFSERHTNIGDALFGTHGDHKSLQSFTRGDKIYGSHQWET